MRWSNMENLKYANKTFCPDTQTTYTYMAESELTEGDKTLASVERWSSRGNKMFSSHSIYRVWVWLNGSPKLLGEYVDSTLKECKALALDYIQTNPKKMKQHKPLKETTIQRYSNKQILKHLDRFMSKHLTIAPFRIDFSFNEVRLYDSIDRAYFYFCSTEDRTAILEALNTVYKIYNINEINKNFKDLERTKDL